MKMDMAARQLNPALWSSISSDLLLFHILPRLPLRYRLTVRAVCKLWNTVLVSQSYWEHCESISPTLSFLVRCLTDYWNFELNLAQLYDYPTESWQEISTHLIPHEILHSYAPVCSEQGLVCFAKLAPGFLSLAVCNPVLDEWINMPELFIPCNHVADIVGLSYKIIPKKDVGFLLIVAATHVVYLFDTTINFWKEMLNFGDIFPDDMNILDVILLGDFGLFLIERDNLSWVQLLMYNFSEDTILASRELDEIEILESSSIFELNREVLLMGVRKERSEIGFWKVENSLKCSLIFVFMPIDLQSSLTDLSATVVKDHNRIYLDGTMCHAPPWIHFCVAINLSGQQNLQFDCTTEVIPLPRHNNLFVQGDHCVFPFKPSIRRLL